MTINAILLRICGANAAAFAAMAVLAAGSAQARDPDGPVTDDGVSAREVATTPLGDLHLDSEDIPETLLAAQRDPYARLSHCGAIMIEVSRLNLVLGEDYDTAGWQERKLHAGRVAQSVVGSFIPFRGVIREVSGANDHQRKMRDAISAGYMRRAYLKGLGEATGCKYPARPATDAIRELIEAERKAAEKQGG